MNNGLQMFVHNVIAHPLMALFQALGLEKLANSIHDSTLPEDVLDPTPEGDKACTTVIKRCGSQYTEECTTPGTVYTSQVHGREISIKAVLPMDMDMGTEAAKKLLDDLHDATASVLKRYF